MAAALKALVVDDDPAFRFLVGAVLERRHIKMRECGDGSSALSAFSAFRPDLILLDLGLPDQTGLTLARAIRSEPGGDLPLILLITGADPEGTLEEALDSGVDDFLVKPVDPAVLNTRLAIAERRILQAREAREREAELVRDTMTDSLTGLATRGLLQERIQRGLSRTTRGEDYLFALLKVDLDAFHHINERHGSEVGNRILMEAARRIQDSIRSVDSPARIAADEFGVFLDGLKDASDVTRVTHRIRERFAEPMRVEEHTLFMGVSMGVTLCNGQYSDPEEVLRDASKALRSAKEEGPGKVRIFDPAHHQAASARMELEERIREALDSNEMVLHYQPIIDLMDPRIVGLEALIRWPQADGSMMPTGEFIPVAEQSALISHLGWWTMERAAKQLHRWHQELPESSTVAVMVNIPGRLFSQPELVLSVEKILRETGLKADFLHLEITETSAMADLDRSLETLRRLKELGTHLHVDDFGTGHSSLSYLHRFPVDSLKVDRSFVTQMTERPENLAIVRTVVDLAKSLGLSVVVEGIETEEQLAFVQEMGCEYGQGWLFAKAMAPEAAETALRNPGELLRLLVSE